MTEYCRQTAEREFVALNYDIDKTDRILKRLAKTDDALCDGWLALGIHQELRSLLSTMRNRPVNSDDGMIEPPFSVGPSKSQLAADAEAFKKGSVMFWTVWPLFNGRTMLADATVDDLDESIASWDKLACSNAAKRDFAIAVRKRLSKYPEGSKVSVLPPEAVLKLVRQYKV